MDTKRKLFDKLREILDDKDFVVGVMSDMQHPEDQKVMLDFIDTEKEATVDDIILLSLHLSNERKNAKTV